MSCFCEQLDDYKCCDCESKERWNKLSHGEKDNLRMYRRLVNLGPSENLTSEFLSLFKWVEKKGLSAADVQ